MNENQRICLSRSKIKALAIEQEPVGSWAQRLPASLMN
jgi:hypothetical protein